MPNQRVMGRQLMAMRPPYSSLGASQVTVVFPQLFPITVMGEQLRPTSTSRPVRSRPRRAATAETALSLEGRTLAQHWGEVGGVAGEVGGVAEEVGGVAEEVGGVAEDVGGVTEEVGGVAEEVGGVTEEVGGVTEEMEVGGVTEEMEVGGVTEEIEVGGVTEEMEVGGVTEEMGGVSMELHEAGG